MMEVVVTLLKPVFHNYSPSQQPLIQGAVQRYHSQYYLGEHHPLMETSFKP